ncbi:zinc uptake transcriptional repressor Zur [Vibrio sp. Of7-15]|uniref:zinc uptake transcriptional repressor Zur n=1 Tax=Vibrio sp. Of7-15 TaxID=2724879 RepID=UPI001EF2BA8A|nr:zinc uptake transcriptional repressor Zur [Vibrio sp. Of7-15]MCG7498743.1 zinc uptake transcriptional repressor Zur [Vibrio sp. Of7-15]
MVLETQLLTKAEQLCQQRGVRLTPQRLRVLELIITHQGAISAYELLDLLRETEPQAKPPTVYRALDFLLSQGFIHRVESTNSFVSCCAIGSTEHCSQLLICDKCGNVEEYHDDNLTHDLKRNAEQLGFVVKHHVLETHGTCKKCH